MYKNKEDAVAWHKSHIGAKKDYDRGRYISGKKQPNPEGYHRERRYGLTQEAFLVMRDAQGGRCAICNRHPKSNKAYHVDHCHKTGKVRGLLCAGCNRSLAALDNPDWLAAAQEYLASR